MRHYISIILIAFLPIGVFLISTDRLQASEGIAKTIRVGIYQNHPLVGQNVDGEPEGFLVDLLTEISIMEGWQIDFILDTFSGILERLENNELDLAAGVAQTAKRDQTYDFTKETVCTLWGIIYVQADSQIQTIHDLDGKLVAVMSKGVFGQSFKRLCSEFSIKPHFVETDSQTESLELLKDHKVYAGVFNNAFREVYDETGIRRTSIIYNPVKVGFAAMAGTNSELLNTIDHSLSEWKRSEKSFYEQKMEKWLGTIEISKEHIPHWLIYSFFFFTLIITLFFFWLIVLKKQIRHRKIAESALVESENRFRTLSDAAYEGIIISEKGNIIDANKATAHMFGYTIEELVKMSAFELVTKDDRYEVQSKILSGYDNPYEIKGLKKDGTIFPIEAHGKMFSHKGREVRVTSLRDLTEQKNAEEEIKKLRGILPICSYCKKIRNDKGAWDIIEAYISTHSEAEFSHGICPECYEKHKDD